MNGVVENGYLPIDVHDKIEILSPPEEGHKGNKADSYVYGRKTFIIQRAFRLLRPLLLLLERSLPLSCLNWCTTKIRSGSN